MTDYKFRDPKTGRTITMRGDGAPPTEAEIEAAFGSAPSDAPPAAKEEGLSSLLPTAGGIVGGIAGGPVGAAAGGAAGQGFRSLANHATELPGAIADIVRSGEPMAAAKGFAEGSGLGAVDAAVQGGIQGAMGAAGNLVMKAPGAILGAAEFMGVPGASMLGRGLRVLKGGKSLLSSAPAAAEQAAPKAAAPATGRLVNARTVRSAEDEIADAIGEVRTASASPRITTPPEPKLPAGFTPRSTVPKPKPAPQPAAEGAPRSRAYFLKPAESAKAPSQGPVGMDDLPASWKAMTAPPTLPPSDIGGSQLAGAYSQELVRRGVKPAAALKAVRNDPDLPPDVKTQIMAALSKVAKNQ